jgi:hypothetical protein
MSLSLSSEPLGFWKVNLWKGKIRDAKKENKRGSRGRKRGQCLCEIQFSFLQNMLTK